VDSDVDVVVEEYVTKFYGPAAGPMREFYRAAERHYALTRPGTDTALRMGKNAAFWEELDGYLKQAEEKTKGLSGSDKRFADRIVFSRDGFNFGRRAFELEAHAGDLVYLKQTKAEFDRMKVKYSGADEYWPTMIATYFYPDVDGMIAKAGKVAAPTPKP
jgi:hypothetical protein